MASMVTSGLDARKSKRYQGVLPAFTQINRNLIAWMYDGEVVLFVPRKYSIDAGFICGCDAKESVPWLNLVDEGAGGRAGVAGRGRFICRCPLNGLGDQKLLSDGKTGSGKVIPLFKGLYGDLETCSNFRKRVTLANRIGGYRGPDCRLRCGSF